MAAISFPSSPTLNQVHTVGQRSWKYNGTAWKLVPRTTDAVVEGSTNLYYTDARVAAAPAVTALETRAGTIESAATTLAGRVTTAEGNITTLTSGLATEKGRVDAILNASQADKDSFAEIVTLINSVDTANDQAFAGYVLSNDAAVAAVASRATTLEEEMDAAEAEIATKVDTSTYASDIGTLQGQITGVDARVVGLEFNLDGVTASRITDIETSISTHVGNLDNPHSVTAAQVGLGNVNNTSDADKPVSTAQQNALDDKASNDRVGEIENLLEATRDRVTDAESDITAIESAATTLAGRVTTAENNISDLRGFETETGNRLGALEGGVASLEGRATTLEGDVSSLDGRLDTAESDITAIEGRATTAEGDIDALETGKQIKNVISATAPSHVEGLIWIDSTDMSSYVSYGSAWVELDRV